MPTYGYECTACKEQFEVFQKMTDKALATHENCGGELRKLLYPVGIVFKGSGFYVNDYGKKPNSEAKSEAKSDKAETKSETTPEHKEPKADTASTAKAE